MRSELKIHFIIGMLLFCGITGPVCSEDSVEEKGNQIISFQVENDLFFDTDQDFTNGLRLSYVSRPNKTVFGYKISDILRSISPLAKTMKTEDLYYSLSFGQNMYTPKKIEEFDVIRTDRPYAGWTYFEFGVTTETEKGYEIIKLDLGLVGPASLAGTVQRNWHSLLSRPPPNGWEHQLPNEPGINVSYARGYRYEVTHPSRHVEMDITPHWGAALGNVHLYGAVGMTVRIGNNLKRDKGAPPRIQPSLPGSDYFSGSGLDFYFFAGVEGRAVERNIFLDGTWRAHEHSVESRFFVGELQVGGVLFAGPYRIAISNVFRSNEFVGAQGGHRYSAMTLSVRF
jgi:hypothetical protein